MSRVQMKPVSNKEPCGNHFKACISFTFLEIIFCTLPKIELRSGYPIKS